MIEPHLDPAELAAAVASELGLPHVGLEERPAGASRRGYVVSDRSGAPIAFLRLDDGGGALSGTPFDLPREAALIRRLHALGFPVPAILGELSAPLPAATIMELAPGTNRPDDDVVERVAPVYLAHIARLHTIDPAELGVTETGTTNALVRDHLRWWSGFARRCGALESPVLRLAERVLSATIPIAPEPPRMLHGDVGAGNFLVDGDRISAILDWETAHVGDVHEDIAWMWMRGAHTPFGDVATRIGEYEAAAGRTLDSDRLRWYLALVTFKSVVGMEARLRSAAHDPGILTALIVSVTYDAILGWCIAGLCGQHVPLLTQEPVVGRPLDARLVGRVIEGVAPDGLDRHAELLLDHLHRAAAHAEWEHTELARDLAPLGAHPDELVDCIDAAPADDLPALAHVVARAADRRSRSLPNAERRIRRALAIGLGT